eukprot:6474939-Amphidinium_carterae.2
MGLRIQQVWLVPNLGRHQAADTLPRLCARARVGSSRRCHCPDLENRMASNATTRIDGHRPGCDGGISAVSDPSANHGCRSIHCLLLFASGPGQWKIDHIGRTVVATNSRCGQGVVEQCMQYSMTMSPCFQAGWHEMETSI